MAGVGCGAPRQTISLHAVFPAGIGRRLCSASSTFERGFCPLPDSLSVQIALPDESAPQTASRGPSPRGSTSLRELGQAVWRRRRLIAVIEGALLVACLLYCLIAPNQYEANARVELRTAPASSLTLEAQEPFASASVLSAPMALETLASVLRSDQLAWRVIAGLKLYQQPGFRGRFHQRFPGFNPDQPAPDAQAWLLERFAWRLHVQTMPRTLLVEIRFRSRDAALSAAVVNALIRAYQEQETESQIQATAQASGWLNAQLADLKVRVDHDQQRLADFEAQHGIVSTPEVQANGQQGETEHAAALLEIDELSRQLVAATTDRILTRSRVSRRFAGRSGDGHRRRSAPAGSKRQLCHRASRADSRAPQRSGAGTGPAQRRTRPQLSARRRNRPSTAGSRPAEAGGRREARRALPQQLANRSRPRAVGAQEPGTGDQRGHEAERGRHGVRRHASGSECQPRSLRARARKIRRSRPCRRRAQLQHLGRRCCPPADQARRARSAAVSRHHLLRRPLDRRRRRASSRVAGKFREPVPPPSSLRC